MNWDNNDVLYCEEVLKSAGEILINYFSKEIEIKEKTSAKDVVTKADLESNEYITIKLKEKYSVIEICSEEKPYDKTKGNYRFIIDPLEGTSNFVLGIPTFVIMIALVNKNEVIFSMIYNPLLKITYYALKDKGAFKNGKKVLVNNVKNLKHSSVHTNYAYATSGKLRGKIDSELYELGIKRKINDWCGGYYFCLVAEGKIEAIISELQPEYDILPGIFLAKEAGARITDWNGKECDNLFTGRTIVSNGGEIHQKLVSVLSKI